MKASMLVFKHVHVFTLTAFSIRITHDPVFPGLEFRNVAINCKPDLQHRCNSESGQNSVNSVVLLTCWLFLLWKIKSESIVCSLCQGSLSTNSSQTKLHKFWTSLFTSNKYPLRTPLIACIQQSCFLFLFQIVSYTWVVLCCFCNVNTTNCGWVIDQFKNK